MWNFVKKFFCLNPDGQSAVELAIFGSILIFVISLIFRMGLSGGNFMRVQLQATRYAMSKSLEMTQSPPGPGDKFSGKPGRNNASTLVIEDRLSGDFANKFGTRDRVPLVASGSGTYSNQLFYPVDASDWGDRTVLPHQDVWVNGQRFSFITADFANYTLPTTSEGLATCGSVHTADSRCWDPNCSCDGHSQGCLVLQKIVQNYPGSGFINGGNFDVNFDGERNRVKDSDRQPNGVGAGKMNFMWQWQSINACGELPDTDPIDVDGDFQEEQILGSGTDDHNRTAWVNVIDQQKGDIDFSGTGRIPNVQVGLLPDSQIFSFTGPGTVYQIKEGKLFSLDGSQYIRNVNLNDHVDVVQRIFQLSNDTGRFCNKNGQPRQLGDIPPSEAWDGDPTDNPVKACGNCFSGANIQKTCFDPEILKLFVRNNIDNHSGRNWVTRTEVP